MEQIEYTQEQLEIANNIIKWSTSPIITMQDLAYTISGYAGTGKSTLAKYIVDSLKKKGKRIGLSAPTHTAKNNISDKVNLPAETLQKVLGLKPNADMERYSPNIKDFKPVTDPLLNQYDYLFIDECSMINQHLFNFLLVSAEETRTRIIFMGDPFQLPPISDTKEVISKSFLIKNVGTLDTILRQDHENPNTEIISIIIDDLKNNTSKAFNKLLAKESVENELGGLIFYDKVDFYKKAIEVFKTADAEVKNRFITFTNNSVTNVNRFINSHVNGDNVFTPGQYLFGYKTIVRDVNEVSLYADNSGSFLTLKDVYVTNSALYKVKDFKEEIIDYRGIKIPSYVVYTEQSLTPFIIPKEDSCNDYAEEVLKLVEHGEATYKWSGMYEFRDMFLLNFNIPDKRNTDKMLVTKSVDYAYAITTHKSQGATYDNSFINLPAYVGIRDIEFRNKLLYVALTRTRGYNYILNI